MEAIWATYGTPIENPTWKTYGKPNRTPIETYGRPLEHQWKTYRKL